MTTRLDLTLQKHPTHEAGIRLLASRDPSGNLKYLDWGAKILASGQALATEVADVLELFHKFNGQYVEAGHRPGHRSVTERVYPDIYSYRPQDLAELRDTLFKIKQQQENKRKKRELLYHIEGEIEADVVYDSPDLIVRHIKNKQASAHYGLGTQWCISMLREEYFEEYETHNATFFFFERKSGCGLSDEFDKVALLIPRDPRDDGRIEAFTSIDRHVDMMALAKAYGPRVFDIFREIHERSEKYPGSAMFHVYAGRATQEQLKSAYAIVLKGESSLHDTNSILESICCNDAASWSLLDDIRSNASALSVAASKRPGARIHRYRHRPGDAAGFVRTILSALVIHPAVPADARDGITKELRRRHVNVDAVRRIADCCRVGVSYQENRLVVRGRRRHMRRKLTLSELRRRVLMHERGIIRIRKTIEKAEAKKKAVKERGR